MIIYIHGFGGSGLSSKAKELRKHLDGHRFIAPSLSYVPSFAIETLKELIFSYKEREEVYLIGSSLGGFYATYLAEYFGIKAVLINPAVNADTTLSAYVGNFSSYYDESCFEFIHQHIAMLKALKIVDKSAENYLLLLQKGDELLDYRQALEQFSASASVVSEGGSHRFDAIEMYIPAIKSFLQLDRDEK